MKYEIEETLAEGGTSTVHLAKGPNGRVVMKILKRALADDPAWRARFERESKALSELRHPNVVPILDSGTTGDGLPFLVLPHLAGRSLRVVLDEDGKRTPDEAWRIARAIAEALAAAHEIGVVHRDVKPDNVILEDDVPKLLDFGLAKEIDAVGVTTTGAPVGTPTYMAPEQWWGRDVGPSVDQYALGVVLFELLAGKPPYASDRYAELMQAHLNAEIPKTGDARVDAFLARLLAKKDRFASMRDAIVAGDAAFGRPSTGRRNFAWAWALFGPCALLLAGYGDSHDPRVWLRQSGLAGWPVFFSFVIVAIVLARRPHLAFLGLIPAALGTFATYTGWLATLESVARANIGERLRTYQEGLFEANVMRFAGALLSVGLLFQSMPAFRGRARAHEIARLVLALVALALLLVAVLAWIEADAALAFQSAGRVARAARVIRDARWEMGTKVTLLVASLLVLVPSLLRILRAPSTTKLPRSIAVLAGGWAVLAALDAGFLSRMMETKSALWSQLAPEFALDRSLVPPTVLDLPHPPVAPTIAITTDRVSVDSEPVGLADALASETGKRVLAADLSHAIAKQKQPIVLVAVDRAVPWSTVRAALSVARDLGATHVVFLFSREAAPVLKPGDPPEAAYVLPGDFGAHEVTLDPMGLAPDPNSTFESVTASLLHSKTLAP